MLYKAAACIILSIHNVSHVLKELPYRILTVSKESFWQSAISHEVDKMHGGGIAMPLDAWSGSQIGARHAPGQANDRPQAHVQIDNDVTQCCLRRLQDTQSFTKTFSTRCMAGQRNHCHAYATSMQIAQQVKLKGWYGSNGDLTCTASCCTCTARPDRLSAAWPSIGSKVLRRIWHSAGSMHAWLSACLQRLLHCSRLTCIAS